ncbi:MAG: Gfo/Idh/MocA family oxidoreductase [Candidatus Omnitrophota bacterium]
MSAIIEKDKYIAAIIGIGRIGMLLESDPKRLKPATHFGMWSKDPRIELKAVCDSNPKNLEIAGSMLPSVRCYSSAEEMLRDVKPDIVSIATWKDTHYGMMKAALNHDVPAIVCEKPIAEKHEHAREIVDEARRKGTHLFINHRRRFDPLLYPLRDEMKNGSIGEIIQASCYYVYGLVTTGTHVIDTLRFFLRDIAGEIVWVAGFPNKFEHFHPKGDPCIDAFIGFENGLKVSLQSLNIRDYDIFNFYFYGRKGAAIFKNIGRDIEIYRIVDSPEHQGFTELSATPSEQRGGAPRNQFGFLADNVIDCLRGKASSRSTGEDSMKTLEVLVAIQKSAESGGKVVKIEKRS